MEKIRLNRKDTLFIVSCLIVLAAGIWIGTNYFHKAFPEASIHFVYNREQAGDIALTYLEGLGIEIPDDYRHASAFLMDAESKTYLEKELGLEEAQQYFGDPVRLWYWQHRWFRPSTKEEYSVSVTPDGAIATFRHLVDEEAEGAELGEDSARVIAANFLFSTMGVDSASVVFFESTQEGRPNRKDWWFTWKLRDFEPVVHTEDTEVADYRYTVSILGDQVGVYREYLHVPESWQADYDRLRSLNEVTGQIASLFLVLTMVAIVVFFIIYLNKREVKWKTAIWFGAIAAVLQFANSLNSLPLTLVGYDTTSSWSGFLTETIVFQLLGAMALGVFILLLTASAEAIYRERYPQKPSLPMMFTVRGLRTKSAFKNILLGITLTSFFLAYQIIFYLISKHYGGWSPADVPYTNLLNTAMPWLAVLLIGFLPAVSEEFMSRMFSIPFFEKILRGRMRWLAVIIPAFIWGFAHSNYPQQPFWIRGVEVGMAGILIGFIMLRFGILACLVWHYTVDALYTAMLLFRSDNPYFIVTAGVATGLLVIPLLAALIAYLRTGTFLPERDVSNEALAPPPPDEEESSSTVDTSVTADAGSSEEIAEVQSAVEYTPLPAISRIVGLVLILIGVAFAFIRPSGLGDFANYQTSIEVARQEFIDSLRTTGWADPDTMQVQVYTNDAVAGGLTNLDVYMLKNLDSLDLIREVAEELNFGGAYRIQAITPGNRLRFSGKYDAVHGELVYLYPMLPEEMALDSLTTEEAQAIAESLLVTRGEDLAALHLETHSENRKPNRIDHTFVFQANDDDPRHIADAKYRRDVIFMGNWAFISGNHYYHVPESWEREREGTTGTRATWRAVRIGLVSALIAWMVVLLVMNSMKRNVKWKKAFIISLFPLLIFLLNSPNMFHDMAQSYFTNVEIDWSIFRLSLIVAILISVIFKYIGFSLGFGLLSSLYKDKYPLLAGPNRKKSIMDAAIAALCGAGVVIVIHSIVAMIQMANPSWIGNPSWFTPDWIVVPIPIFSLFNQAISGAFSVIMLIAFLTYLWTNPLKAPWKRILIIIGLILMLIPANTFDGGEWTLAILRSIITIGFMGLAVKFVIRGQPVLLISFVLGSSVFQLFAEAMRTQNAVAIGHGTAFLILTVIMYVGWLLKSTKKQIEV